MGTIIKLEWTKKIALAASAALFCAGAGRADQVQARPATGGTPPAAETPAQQPAPKQTAPAASQPAGDTNTSIIEKMPDVRACNPTPRPMLMSKGPRHEMFTVICSNGYGLLVQCESGSCKVLNAPSTPR